MMNKTTITRLIGAIAIAALAAACSDGELKLGGGADITPPAPVIIKFAADPAEVVKGGSTTLTWEVEEADSIEIAAAPEGIFQFHAGPFEEMTGSTVVDGITDTTDFILTASKTVMVATPADTSEQPAAAFVIHKAGQIPLPGEPPVPALNPQTVTSQATITVVVVGDECSIDITADATAPLNAGESTTIRWTAAPDTASVVVTSNDGAPIADTFPAVGNATVTPGETTTYTATATCPNGEERTDQVTVQVNNANIQATVLVNGMKNPTISSLTEPVTVTWTVTPANAKVTVNASPAATCEPALPSGVESASGTASCTLTGTTTFTINAELGDAHDDDDATATLIGGSTNLNVKADPWAFVSEEVEVEVQADAETVSGIDKIDVNGTNIDKTQLVTGVAIRTRVPDLAGIPITIHRIGIAVPEVQHPIQNIVPLEGHQFFHGAAGDEGFHASAPLKVTKVAYDSTDKNRFYYGVQRDQFGEISIYRLNNFEDSKEFSVNIEAPLKAAFAMSDLWSSNTFFSDQVKTYPVGSITVREDKPLWIFAASTGIIMYSSDGGDSWKPLDYLYYVKGSGYEGSHPTCAGETQSGRNGAGHQAGEIVGMGQVCDMIAMSDGRLIVAYDRGVVVTDNVENYITNPRSAPWYGIPRDPSAAGFIYGFVAHDLEQANGKIFAATNKGVYVNTAGDGKVWEAFSSGSLDNTKRVYSIVFDAKSSKLFAGADDGVYVSDVASANWTKTEGALAGPVLSLAVDPAYNEEITGPVVLAGTANGMAVTRDGGKFWSVLNSSVASDLKPVRSIALAAILSGSKVTYKISAAGQGYAAGSVEVGATTSVEPSSRFSRPAVYAMPVSH